MSVDEHCGAPVECCGATISTVDCMLCNDERCGVLMSAGRYQEEAQDMEGKLSFGEVMESTCQSG